MTPTLKGATALHMLRTHGSITTAELARAAGCNRTTAYRVLVNLSLSRRFCIFYDRPYWHLIAPRCSDCNEMAVGSQ
jgi:hypothetical protein